MSPPYDHTEVPTMKRVLVAILVIACTIAIIAPSASASQRRRTIRYQSLQRGSWTRIEVARTIRAAVHHWSVPGGSAKAIDVASCESGLSARADNGTCCAGVFQHNTTYWPGRQNRYDRNRWELAESVYNARANVIVAIRMAHSGGWSPWSCA